MARLKQLKLPRVTTRAVKLRTFVIGSREVVGSEKSGDDGIQERSSPRRLDMSSNSRVALEDAGYGTEIAVSSRLVPMMIGTLAV